MNDAGLLRKFLENENRFWSVFSEDIPVIAFADRVHQHTTRDGSLCDCPGEPIFNDPVVEMDIESVQEVLARNKRVVIWCLVENKSTSISKGADK